MILRRQTMNFLSHFLNPTARTLSITYLKDLHYATQIQLNIILCNLSVLLSSNCCHPIAFVTS